MAFSVSSQNSLPFLNPSPSSSFPFLSLQHHTNFPSFFKPLRFNPSCSQKTTQSQTLIDTNQPQPVKIDIQVQKKKRKPKPSFYEQIREKWSQKPISQTKKFPWQQQEEEEEESSQSEAPVEMVTDADSSDSENPKFFCQLVNRRGIEEPIVCSERNFDQTLSKVVSESDPVSSDLDNSLVSALFDSGNKPRYTHFDRATKTVQNRDVNIPLQHLDIVDEVESNGNVEEVQTEISTLFTSKYDVHSGVSLNDKLASVEVKRDKASFKGSPQERDANRLPWMPENDSDKRSKTELAEKTIPEHELKRLRNVALRMKERIKVGAAGVTEALVDAIHEKWKIDEVVKLKFEGPPSLNMKRIHEVLERRRPYKALSPDICVMCFKSGETNEHLFLHCSFAWRLWRRLFNIFEEEWVCPPNLLLMLQVRYEGFGFNNDKMAFWVCAMLSIIWSVWNERNSRIFDDQYLSEELVWDKVVHSASLYIFANRVFPGIPFSLLKRD